MQYPNNSSEYDVVRLSWPKWHPKVCVFCKSKIIYKYADNGKKVHTLDGIIYQVINYYSCTNPRCQIYQSPFNPNPRFDYGERSYGADVFRLIAEKLLLYDVPIKSIWKELHFKYQVHISDRTVARICDDIINLKAYQIDLTTKSILIQDSHLLLGFDGQDPGKAGKALWIFLDVLHNRVLATYIVDTIDSERLHSIIKKIQEEYSVKIIGFVSDKQNLITKCCKTYYPDIPHQYCQFHFLRNSWNHLETLDSNIYLPLKKEINKLYINRASQSNLVYFEGKGNYSVRTVFIDLNNDLQIMTKVRNKTFKQLRGKWIYEKLTEYLKGMHTAIITLDPDFRITIIMKSTYNLLQKKLQEVSKIYTEVCHLNNYFQQIREALKDSQRNWLEQQQELDLIYQQIWTEVQQQDNNSELEKLRSFLPKKEFRIVEIMGEWCRLWESYRPGLFQYRYFPQPIKTNNACETGFSKEKQAIIRRCAKMNVGYTIATRGEAYLRLVHCKIEELRNDIVQEYSTFLLKELRVIQSDKISKITQYWRKSDLTYEGYNKVLNLFYPALESL